jgi:hypothetical protein
MSNAVQALLLKASQLIASVTGETGGAGVGAGFGFGTSVGNKVAVGVSFSASARVLTDQTGASATPPTSNLSTLAIAANAGIQGSVSTQTIDQMIQHQQSESLLKVLDVGGSGAYGPVALDVSRTGGALTLGPNVGARFGGGPTGGVSLTIPVCKQ